VSVLGEEVFEIIAVAKMVTTVSGCRTDISWGFYWCFAHCFAMLESIHRNRVWY